MNIKTISIVLLLPLFIISGCDSDQKSPTSKKDEALPSVPVATEAPTINTIENEVIEVEVELVQKAALSGEQVYKKSCVNCHGTDVAGAPKVGDAAAWSSRIAKGAEVLYNSAIKGVSGTAMMARGTCGACTDEELEAAVDFMVTGSK